MNKTYIRALDEGYACSTNVDEYEGDTALMVNPDAETNVLIDAAMVRAARIEDLTLIFLEAEHVSHELELSQRDLMRSLISVGAMASEIKRLLQAALSDEKLRVAAAPPHDADDAD